MNKAFNISYIISTFNRLPFLKITLPKLIESLAKNEEIVVVDGDSKDGTKEYLSDLYNQGKIHQFISEPDKNQAHGWNKAMLMSKGKIIKKIIDDDVFDYNSIRKCANYMLQNPEVDIVISNDLSTQLDNLKEISKNSRLMPFKKWAKMQTSSFTFGDVHMLIRKKSLSLIGLYSTSYIMIDWEYSLRISYLKANIAYYTGYNALSVYHEKTVSGQKVISELEKQSKIAMLSYNYKGDRSEISIWSKVKIAVGKKIYTAIHQPKNHNEVLDLNGFYSKLYKKLTEVNENENFEFLISKNFDETKS